MIRLIDLVAILQKSLDRVIFFCIFARVARMSGVRASLAIVHIRKFFKRHKISFDSNVFFKYLKI